MSKDKILQMLKENSKESKINNPQGLEVLALNFAVRYALSVLNDYEIEGEDFMHFAVLLSECAFTEHFDAKTGEEYKMKGILKVLKTLYKEKGKSSHFVNLGVI